MSELVGVHHGVDGRDASVRHVQAEHGDRAAVGPVGDGAALGVQLLEGVQHPKAGPDRQPGVVSVGHRRAEHVLAITKSTQP